MKNITFSADEAIIEQARRQAATEKTTLNRLFREWLQRYVAQPSAAEQYQVLMERLEHVYSEQTYTREEMNERR